ncbi:MmgE/PrpD family protein [Salipiger sp. PrR002]|uniref:MmgE/PrpD family protein n=1 Tax=Salipiger sp. PrR002 TaxID=2706489 RepID=UPI0013B77D9C|nr:MmgE/PrpD family protein [Salipiger sp. PrR002]NDW01455.1 MmgE/PrpD family protein [Salipiger sp. PrR002]NDW58495.1 MmgE/PrpD family protein [Salipiger sp. PrR004]
MLQAHVATRENAVAEPLDALIELAALPLAHCPAEALALARVSLVDWLICGIAGASEPVATKIRSFAASEGQASAEVSVFGGSHAPARTAAMVNGTISHALDYDDTHFDHVGHLSVGIYPAALAMAEAQDASAEELVTAFFVGAEGAIRLGRVLGLAHYNRGFHQTATAGAFGATLAAGRIAKLDDAQMRAALGLCATRASGLKSQFGTMGKPLNAGIAASNGVEAVQLAALGLSSPDDGVFGQQGFVETHADAPEPFIYGLSDMRFMDNRYKFHACCHGLHAMIEGLRAIAAQVDIEQVERLHVRTNPRWLKVCDLKAPRTGLEVKFSYVWLAGMVLSGLETGEGGLYTDALAADPILAAFARKVEITGDPTLSDQQGEGTLVLRDGTQLTYRHDLAAPVPPAELMQRVAGKARTVLGVRAAPLLAMAERIDADPRSVPARDIGALIRA